MKKIDNSLKKYIKNMNGNLLGIGIKNDDLIKLIEKNDNILICDLLNCSDIYENDDKCRKRMKKIPIKKIKKVFKNKRFDYVIANINELQNYFRTFVGDSVYLSKNKIYLYINEEYDYERLENMYKRYNATLLVEKCTDGYILTFDLKNSKKYKLKNKFYYIVDMFYDIFDKIGDFLSEY